MPTAHIQHVLIIDSRGDALAAYLGARRADLAYRVRTPTTLAPGDPEWADALVGFSPPISLDRSAVRWVHSTGAGVDAWLDTPRWPDGVTLTRTTGDLGVRMAEYCVGHALAVSQRIVPFHRDQQAARWAPVEPSTLRGTTAVVLGTGSVGSAIAAQFHAVGCRTIGISRSGRPASGFDEVYPVDRLADRVVDARWLVLAAPLTPLTRHVVGAEVLAQLTSPPFE
jgi:D-2-hydroxyacid dehydrogenase (NADP+)